LQFSVFGKIINDINEISNGLVVFENGLGIKAWGGRAGL
jgi:hypothetical protein